MKASPEEYSMHRHPGERRGSHIGRCWTPAFAGMTAVEPFAVFRTKVWSFTHWIPAFAGMTARVASCVRHTGERRYPAN